MKLQNAINKIEKAGGNIVSISGNIYSAAIGNSIVEFVYSSRYETVSAFGVRSANDQHNVQNDYNANIYCDNLSRAIKLAAA